MPEVCNLYTAVVKGRGAGECLPITELAVWLKFGKIPTGSITLDFILHIRLTPRCRKCKCPEYIHALVDMLTQGQVPI